MTRILNRKGTSKRTARDLLTYYRAGRKWGMTGRQAKVFATYFIDATNVNIASGLWAAWCVHVRGRAFGWRGVERRDSMNGFTLRIAYKHLQGEGSLISGWPKGICSGPNVYVSKSAPTDRDCERIECFDRHVAPALKPLYERAGLSADAPWQILADALTDANDEQGANVVRALFE